ncbi:MAG: hypothetical protein ACLRPQ_01115 [Streptococcus sp.]
MLTDSALVIPTTKTGRPFLTRVVTFSAPFGWTGGKGKDNVVYKGMNFKTRLYNRRLQ